MDTTSGAGGVFDFTFDAANAVSAVRETTANDAVIAATAVSARQFTLTTATPAGRDVAGSNR
ncbi:hypothetical protein C482_03266 [Natrialba chahannaoensis JCM 10990]|uniref:Uncharacterized protein n=1 Tax=Natrialba chahannaoensis JCM 10990 TaxID=1227492 RepID=M0B1J0_9EURY|nr:hypothetical protein C482_03266 [Natrialba chahannaoensis JCM 10990]